jgi:predicted nucleic acid-binding protein
VKRFVLDASGLVAFFEDLPGAAKIEELIGHAVESRAKLCVCVINWGEVCYSLSRARGVPAARKALSSLAQLPIEVVDADSELTAQAVALRGEYELSYSSSFAAALAHMRRASLVTVDRKFAVIQKHLSITWADATEMTSASEKI